MTEYYLDASVLVKRYADEAGSVWIRQITEREAQHTILLAEMTLAEVASALAAKHRARGRMLTERGQRKEIGPVIGILRNQLKYIRLYDTISVVMK